MKLLFHVCCAPCFVYPLGTIKKSNKIDLKAFFFNPNIHPYQEFLKRLESAKIFLKSENIDSILYDAYEPHRYVEKIKNKLTNRCSNCYELRLHETAEYALKNGFDSFTTSLLVSPYQKHNLIKETGERIAAQVGVNFLYEDWRPGYSYGRQRSKEYELYSQKYCGCFYSEFERYR